jgi:hypothetical protein
MQSRATCVKKSDEVKFLLLIDSYLWPTRRVPFLDGYSANDEG